MKDLERKSMVALARKATILGHRGRQEEAVSGGRQAIMMTQIDSVQCANFFCSGCSEVYHDRNFPVNLP